MGLAVGIGVLADLVTQDPEGADWQRESITAMNAVLRRNGKPEHREPERFPKPLFRLQRACTSFPYSFLHYLRRAFAHMRQGRPIPDDDKLRPEHDNVVADEASMLDSHLLCHSDCEGFYVPIEIGDPIFDDELPGAMLGSSQALLAELIEVAPHIGVTLENGRLTPECEDELRGIEDSAPLWRERLVWYTLFEAATLSIEHQSLIVFH